MGRGCKNQECAAQEQEETRGWSTYHIGVVHYEPFHTRARVQRRQCVEGRVQGREVNAVCGGHKFTHRLRVGERPVRWVCEVQGRSSTVGETLQ